MTWVAESAARSFNPLSIRDRADIAVQIAPRRSRIACEMPKPSRSASTGNLLQPVPEAPTTPMEPRFTTLGRRAARR